MSESIYVDIGGEKGRGGESYVKVGKYKYRAADLKGLLENYQNHGAGIDCNYSTLDEWLVSAGNRGTIMIEDPDSPGTALWVPRGFTPPRSARGLFEGGDGSGGPFNPAELEDIWNWCHSALDEDRAPITRSQRTVGDHDIAPLVHLHSMRGFESQPGGGKRLRRRRRTQSRKRQRMSIRRRRQSKKSRRSAKHRRTRR